MEEMEEKIAPGHREGPLTPDSLCVPAGDTLVRHVRFLAADGSPLNVSDPLVSIRWQIITPEGMEMLTKKTGDPGVTIVSAVDGLVRLLLTPRETRLFPPGCACYLAARRVCSELRTLGNTSGIAMTTAARPLVSVLAAYCGAAD